MVHPLIGIHAALGELGIFAFLWVLVELIDPTENRIRRAKFASLIGVILFLLAWLTGGYYYATLYGSDVKPIIKEGPTPWAHSIFMEVKEHVYLFLPFLSILTSSLIYNYQKKLIVDKKAKRSIILLCILIILIGLSMAAMGYIISTGARLALEALAK